jgi:hypothetical protein
VVCKVTTGPNSAENPGHASHRKVARRSNMSACHVQRTSHPSPAFIQHVCINYGCPDVLVAEKFLDRPYVVSIFQQVSGKAVPKRVACPSYRVADSKVKSASDGGS